MEHLVLFGPGDAQQKWQRLGDADSGELACVFLDRSPAFSGNDTLATAIDRARRRLQDSSGIVISTAMVGGGAQVTVRRSGKAASLPARVLVVGLEGRHEWREISDEETLIHLTGWQSLIVPATDGLDKRLTAFINALQDLPADYRTAMLFNLVVPTLESRISSLELKEPLERLQPADGVTHGSRGGVKSWSLVRDSLLLGSVIPVLFGLGTLFYSFWRLETALNEHRQALQNGFAALGVAPAALARGGDNGQGGVAKTAASPAPPAATATPHAGSLEDRLSRFLAGSGKQSESFVMDAIEFQGSMPVINAAATVQIHLVADVLKKNPNVAVEIQGHSDSQGTDEGKRRISKERANAIQAELITAGADAMRLRTVAFADAMPLRDESPQSPRNRRVEVQFNR